MSVKLKFIQETLVFISKNGYKVNHVEFLKSTAVFLAELFDVNFVLIDKYSIKTPNITETVVLYGNGRFIQNLSYNLENTPCDTIINKKLCSYPANVINIFPKDDFLRQNNMESYIGKPLWNPKKEPIGLIALMDTKPKSLTEENNIAIVLDIIAIKIEEVLEKMLFEDQLNLKIGELIIAKEKAEKSEHQLNVAQKIANLGHWEHDIINNKLIWSDEIYRILNLKPQELEAREDLFVKNVHPDDKDKIEKEYLNAFKNKKAYVVEYRLMLPSGEIKYILGKGHKKYDDKGNPIYSFGTVIDITKQKKVEQKLVKLKEEAEKSEEKFKKLANLIFVGVLITEKGDVALECNKVFLTMFGYSRKEIVGKSLTKLLFPEKYHAHIKANRNKKQTLPYEIEGIRKDGTIFPIEIEARNIDFGNNTINRLVTFRDSSSRKKAEIENKKLITAIEQSANMVLIADINGNIEYTNPKFTEITGYTAAEVLGKNPSILKSGAQPKEFYANLWQTITEGNIWSGQMKNKTKNGNFYWEQLTITPIKDENGKILSYLAIKEDITHRKIAEDNLKESEEKYRFLFENNPQPMWIYDSETLSFLEVNYAAIQHYGYTREEFLSMTLKDIRPKEDIDALLKDIDLAKRIGYSPASEWLHIKKSGEIINVNIVSHKVTLNNREARHILINDITSTKKAQQNLLKATEKITKSEKKFRDLFEKSGDAILIIKNGVFVDCNQATIDLLGYKKYEDVLNLRPSELSPIFQPDGIASRKKAEEMMRISLKNGTHRFEWIHTKSNGELFPVEVLLTAISNEPNNKIIHCVWRDITGRKHTENELRDAYESIKDRENFVSKILETANEGFWLIDEKANTIDLNAEMCKILGYSETSVKGKSIFDFVDEKNSKIFKNQLENRKIGKSSVYEIELLSANGKNVPCLFKTSPIFNNQNEVSGSFALVSDITNIKETLYKVEIQNLELRKLSNELSEKNRLLLQSKDRFINLFEQNPVPLWEQDFSAVKKLLKDKKFETTNLKMYLDENPDFVSACISKIKILNANKAALALFGVKNTEELKIHLGKTNSKKALEVFKKELVSIGANKKTFSGETELTGKDGSLILALIKSVIIDDYGTSIASVIDITAERNATNELQKAKEIAEKSENSLNEAQKLAQTGSYELDFSTGFWNSSPALNDIFGIDEKYNKNINGWLGIIHPEDLQMMERYLEKNISENKEEFNKEYRIIRKTDKQISWVHGLGKLEMDHKGNLKKMIGTIQDISEKRQILQDLIIAKEKAEESENNLKKRAKELLGIYTLHQLTEKNTDPEIIYKTLVDDIIPKSMQYSDKVYCKLEINNQIFCNSDDCKICNSKVCKIPEGKKYLSEKIWVNKKEIGELKIFYTENLPFIEPYETNLIEAYAQKISVFLDRRDLFEKLLNSKEKAEESDRLKTEFIQNMSHEIRTPMNGILGFTELLENPDLSHEKRKKFIEVIKNSTHQLLHIIDDLMEISVLETKQIKAEENPVCLNDLLRELFAVFNLKATSKNIELVLKNELTNQESTILTDKNKLNKVLSNLLENALKFTNEGFVELGYQLKKGSEPAELEIYVKDSGIGIKPEKQQLIFDRFSQVERELSKKIGGLGLGLSIAKENVALLGGKITVVSELRKGAVFFVSIPYKPAIIAAEISIEKENTSEKKDQYTILIAEDEEVNFMVWETLLIDRMKLHCTILHAKDGLEAVELTKINPDIGLVLMDIKMPKMDGHEATKKIKEFRPNLPIIAQTAYSSPEEKERAFLAGCDDFISKPISKDVLKSMLGKYLLTDKNNGNTLNK